MPRQLRRVNPRCCARRARKPLRQEHLNQRKVFGLRQLDLRFRTGRNSRSTQTDRQRLGSPRRALRGVCWDAECLNPATLSDHKSTMLAAVVLRAAVSDQERKKGERAFMATANTPTVP